MSKKKSYNIERKILNVPLWVAGFIVLAILCYFFPIILYDRVAFLQKFEIKQIRAVMCYLTLLIYLFSLADAILRSGKKFMRGREMGTSRFEDVEDFTEKLENKNNPNCNMILSMSGKKSLDSKQTLLNNNTLCVGGSGAGKTAGFIATNLLQNFGSNIITDPKGDTVRDFGVALEKQGRIVKKLDLTVMKDSLQFNPFPYMKEENQVDELVDNIIANTTDPDAGKGDAFWENAESMFDKFLFFYVWQECPQPFYKYTTYKLNFDSELVDVDKELSHIKDELLSDDRFVTKTQTRDRKITQSIVPIYRTPIKDKDGNQLTLSQSFRSVLTLLNEAEIKDRGASDLDVRMLFLREKIASEGKIADNNKCLMNYNKTMRGAADTVRSIVISANARFDKFHNEELLRILDDDEMELESLFTGKIGDKKADIDLFLVIPDDKSTYNFVIGMLYTLLFQIGYEVARNNNGKCPQPVGMWLDEFANIKMPKDFEKILATCRSREIYLVIILQSIAQLKTLYPNEQYEGIIGNCDTFLYLGGNEQGSHKYISEIMGKMTIDKQSQSTSLGKQGGSSLSDDVLGRELMDPTEVRMLPNSECLFIVRGHYPVRDKKCYWFKMKEYDYIKKLDKWNTNIQVKKVGDRLVTLKGNDLINDKGIIFGKEALNFENENENIKFITCSLRQYLFNNDSDFLNKNSKKLDENLNKVSQINVNEVIDFAIKREQDFDKKIKKAIRKKDNNKIMSLIYSQKLTDGQFEIIKQAIDDNFSPEDIEIFAKEGMGEAQTRFLYEQIKKEKYS